MVGSSTGAAAANTAPRAFAAARSVSRRWRTNSSVDEPEDERQDHDQDAGRVGAVGAEGERDRGARDPDHEDADQPEAPGALEVLPHAATVRARARSQRL